MSKHNKTHNTFNLSRIPWSGGSLFLSHTFPFFRGEQRRKATRTRIRLKRMGWDDVIREESAGRRRKKKGKREESLPLSLSLSFLFSCASHTPVGFFDLFSLALGRKGSFSFFSVGGEERGRILDKNTRRVGASSIDSDKSKSPAESRDRPGSGSLQEIRCWVSRITEYIKASLNQYTHIRRYCRQAEPEP